MTGLLRFTIAGVAVLVVTLAAMGQEANEPSDAPQEPDRVRPSILDRSSDRAYEVLSPQLGRGYIGYELPAVDSCPYSNERCFHPCRYYFGGKPYARSWCRRWLGAHLGHGSMLDAFPEQCLSPGLTRPYWRTVSPEKLNSRPTPVPAAKMPTPEE